METLKYLDICNINGELLVTLLVRVRDEKAQPQVSPQKPSDVQKGENGQDKGNGIDKMTEAQQRKLFRMLAEKGMHGDKAHEELKRRFQVKDLGDVSKQEASRMIEKLIGETKGGR
jgi:hypothetical protein